MKSKNKEYYSLTWWAFLAKKLTLKISTALRKITIC